jgi:hypothetical protein
VRGYSVHLNKELIRVEHCIGRDLFIPLEIADVERDEIIGKAGYGCRVDMGVVGIGARVGRHIEVGEPASLESLCELVPDRRNPPALPVRVLPAQVIEHFGHHILSPEDNERRCCRQRVEQTDPVA